MSLLKKYSSASKENALKILETSLSKLESMDKSFTEAFPYPSLSAASTDFQASAAAASNDKVAAGVALALDAITSISQDTQTIENFLHLHIPKMEDGNNFGVTVQLALLKQLSELQEAIGKHIEALLGYANARAEALGKLGLPSASKSVTKSTSSSTTDGKPEEKTSEATEEKTSENALSGPGYESRVASIVAVDALYYSKAQRAFQAVMTLYIACLDFMDKNKEKLEKPKGSGGSHSGYSSMY